MIVDTEPHARHIALASARLLESVLTDRSGHSDRMDPLVNWSKIVMGKKAEAAYAIAHGLDPEQITRDAMGKPDFRTRTGVPVDVKAMPPMRPWLGIRLNVLTRPGHELIVAAQVHDQSYRVNLYGWARIQDINTYQVSDPHHGHDKGYARVPLTVFTPFPEQVSA